MQCGVLLPKTRAAANGDAFVPLLAARKNTPMMRTLSLRISSWCFSSQRAASFRRAASFLPLALSLAALVSGVAACAQGDTISTVYAFSATNGSGDNPDGANPYAQA